MVWHMKTNERGLCLQMDDDLEFESLFHAGVVVNMHAGRLPVLTLFQLVA